MRPMTLTELLRAWAEIRTDRARFEFVREHRDAGIVLYLDNDGMFWGIPGEEIEENTYFDSYIGWKPVAFALCEAYGIEAECV